MIGTIEQILNNQIEVKLAIDVKKTTNLINLYVLIKDTNKSFIGEITEHIPKIKRIFIMLLPITVPIIISPLLDNIELQLIANSGALVPKETIVSPIRILGILKCFAISDAPSIK